MKTRLLAAGVCCAVSFAATIAHAVTIQGITFAPTGGFQFMEIALAEEMGNGNGIIDNPGETLHGILRVTSIVDHKGNQTWANGVHGRELTGYFHDFRAIDFTDVGGKRYINFTGGVVDMYSDSTPDFERNGPRYDDIAKATDSDRGTLWLTLVGSRLLSVESPFGPFITLRLEVGLLSSVVAISAIGLLDVVGGAVGPYFDSEHFFDCVPGTEICDDADMTFIWSVQGNAITPPHLWASFGTGQLDVYIHGLPEPDSLSLLLLALSGIVIVRHRRGRHAVRAITSGEPAQPRPTR